MPGFNRIELLVTIGLILSVLIVGILGFLELEKGLRDSKRKADIGIIAGALELHYNTKTDQFCSNAQTNSYCHPQYAWFQGGVPTDPIYGDYLHLPVNGDKQFMICAKLEREAGNNGGYYCQANQQ